MKKIYYAILALFLLGLSAEAQLTPELIYYRFDGSGGTVPNLALTPPPGTATGVLTGAITQGSPGICGGALLGTGGSASSDYVNTGWAPNLGNGAWTVSFRTSDIPNTTTLYYIFGDGGTTGWRVFTNGVAGNGNWIMRGPHGDVIIAGGATVAPHMNTWVYDPVAGNVKGYLDGVLVATTTQASVNLNGAGPLRVGGYSSGTGLPVGGKMDDFRLYHRALSAQEVLDVYNGAAGAFLGPDTLLCQNASITLSVPSSGGMVMWSDSSTADTLLVTMPGTYSVAYSGTCESGNDTIVIGSIPTPQPGFVGQDTVLCTGDSVMYSTGYPGVSTVWSTGDTTDMVTITMPGTYTVEITNQCGTFMDTVDVVQSALVYSGFIAPDSNYYCEGDSALLMSVIAYDTYVWSSGGTAQSEMVSGTGTYILEVTDGCGSGMDSISLVFNTAPTAGFSNTPNMMSVSFTNASTGSGPLSYAWDFGDQNTSTQQDPMHTYAANGTYIVTLTVTNGCGTSTVTDTILIDVVGMDPSQGISYEVYPNPAQQEVTVSGNVLGNTSLRIRLVNALGQTVQELPETVANGAWAKSLNIRDLPDGIYYLQVNADQVSNTTRLVIQH
jgi:PKD repeat protein